MPALRERKAARQFCCRPPTCHRAPAAAGDEALYRSRVLKAAIHELGRTLGLGHCDDPHCVMHFSNSLADTDRKGSRLCRHCRARLSARPPAREQAGS